MAQENTPKKTRHRSKMDKDKIVSDAFFYAFRKMGGKKALLKWANENQDEFFKQFKTALGNKKTGDDKKIIIIEDLK